ncbi:MAG: hypothetical protein HY319_03900 [Armatimonadetes bacterium]|nr:hypothetical protein [Armatimonadota bacterium]
MSPAAGIREELAALLAEGDLLVLGARAAARRPSPGVGFLEDSARRGAAEAAPETMPRWIDVAPEGDLEGMCRALGQLRRRFPQAHLHGLTPAWLSRQPAEAASRLVASGLGTLALYTGPLSGECPYSEGWVGLLDTDIPKVGCVVYGPEDPAEAIVERLMVLSRARGLKTVLCLPAAPGDLMLVRGATTDGNLDMRVLSVARLALPVGVHVRASWGALGWKVAQVALAFGADELAGFGLEERLTYLPRTRPASIVEREEVLAGIREALLDVVEVHSCDWAS